MRFSRASLTHPPIIRHATSPMPIEVTAAEEITILQHLDTFEANGFGFEVRTFLAVVPRSRTVR